MLAILGPALTSILEDFTQTQQSGSVLTLEKDQVSAR
jgi:hypothetical protein